MMKVLHVVGPGTNGQKWEFDYFHVPEDRPITRVEVSCWAVDPKFLDYFDVQIRCGLMTFVEGGLRSVVAGGDLLRGGVTLKCHEEIVAPRLILWDPGRWKGVPNPDWQRFAANFEGWVRVDVEYEGEEGDAAPENLELEPRSGMRRFLDLLRGGGR